MVFMGDTGSMATGGFLGGLALLTKHEIYCWYFFRHGNAFCDSGPFFKRTRKRIFLMAPYIIILRPEDGQNQPLWCALDYVFNPGCY